MRRARRIAIVGHSAIPHDPRLAKQAAALVAAGFEVDVFGLREPGQLKEEQRDGVRLVRLPVHRRWHGLAGHLAEYAAFTGLAVLAVAREHRNRRYDLVQIAAPPDFLVAAGMPIRWTGVPVILDLHEDMPAMFRDRFAARGLDRLTAVVEAVTRASATMADDVLICHAGVTDSTAERGTPRDRIHVVMNGADDTVFDPARYPSREFMADGVLRLMHHSSFHEIYGADVAVEAVSLLGDRLPVRLDIYGEGPFRSEIEAAVARFGAEDRVTVHGRVPLAELPALIAASDIGLVPSRPYPYGELLLSTKLLEYATMGIPTIASDLAMYRHHLPPDGVRYVAPGDASAFARGVEELVADPAEASARGERARAVARRYAWSAQAARYVEVVNASIARSSRGRSPRGVPQFDAGTL